MWDKGIKWEIMEKVEKNWPTHIKELVKEMGFEVNNNNIKKISYHIRQLEKEEKVKTKRIGQSLVIWPVEMEKLRVIHELLKVE